MNKENLAREAEVFWRERYAAAFIDKDPEYYAGAFSLPCIIRAENLDRTVCRTREELTQYCSSMLERAKATTWETSVIDTFEVRILDPQVATITVEASRFDAGGALLSRLYGSYTMNREQGEWKMVAIFGGFMDQAQTE